MEQGFDQFIRDTLEETFQKALLIESPYSHEQIRLMIAAENLGSIARTFLLADSKPDEIRLNLKQIALGILGTQDWLKEGIE